MPKYGNKKTLVGDIWFDSKKEARRYQELTLLEKAGEITDLEIKKRFQLIPKKGKERPAYYTCDFAYRDAKSGALVVEDVKSEATKTQVYVLRRKLMYQRYDIQIREV
jgi:hypothetical protein